VNAANAPPDDLTHGARERAGVGDSRMARRAHWLCLACLAGGLRAAAADLPARQKRPSPPRRRCRRPHDLVMAACCIERGRRRRPSPTSPATSPAYPDRVNARAYLAELLWRHGGWPKAKAEFERYVGDAQSGPVEAKRLVHAPRG